VPSTDTYPVPLAPGLTARRLDPDADRAGVVEIVRAYDAVYARGVAAPPEEVVSDLLSSGENLARDAWLVVEGDRAVGFCWFTTEDASAERPIYWFDVYVTPQLPADAGLEFALAAAMLDRAREELAASGAPVAHVDSGCLRDDDRTRAALEAAGLQHVRTLWRMERRLDEGGAADPAVDVVADAAAEAPPAGVTVRLARDEPADRSLLHRLFTTTFAQHWGTAERDEERWWSGLRGGVRLDPTQWWIADIDGVPAAFLMGDASRAPDGGGYLRLLGVLPEARGRGAARQLLRVAFAEHARRGWTWTQLTVDTGNVTGAPQLYGSVGMEPVEVIDLYRLELRRDDGIGPR
jgi:ribosomal protein S18 acetylase RimI-like enzyme